MRGARRMGRPYCVYRPVGGFLQQCVLRLGVQWWVNCRVPPLSLWGLHSGAETKPVHRHISMGCTLKTIMKKH